MTLVRSLGSKKQWDERFLVEVPDKTLVQLREKEDGGGVTSVQFPQTSTTTQLLEV